MTTAASSGKSVKQTKIIRLVPMGLNETSPESAWACAADVSEKNSARKVAAH